MGNCPINRGNCPWGNCPTGVMVLGGSCPWGNCPGGSCPRGVMALRDSRPWGSCPQGSCPRGSCPRGSCPRTVLKQGTSYIMFSRDVQRDTPLDPPCFSAKRIEILQSTSMLSVKRTLPHATSSAALLDVLIVSLFSVPNWRGSTT